MSQPPTTLLTPDQLGEIYQVCGRTIRRWHEAGEIPAAVAVGQVYRFDAAEVAEALRKTARKNSRRNQSAALA